VNGLPEDWEIVKLVKLGSFTKGKGISKGEVLDSGYPCIRYAEIYTEYNYVIKEFKSFINEESAKNSNELKQNDILFAGSGETVEDIGKSVAFISDFKAFVGGDTVVFTPKENILDSVFMSYQINNNEVRKQLRKLAQGNSVVHIYSKGIMNIKVNFPPLNEQKKIANILSTVDEKIALIDNQIEETETLKKGLMQKLLTEGIGHGEFKDSEIGRIPVGWGVIRLGKHIKLMGGYAFKSKDSRDNGVKWLKIANVGINNIKWEQISYLPKKYLEEYSKFILNENDIVLAMTRPILGTNLKIAKIKQFDLPALLNQRVGKFFFDLDTNSEFMYQLFQDIEFIKILMLKILGTDPPNVSSEQVESIKVVFPPLTEQKQIAQILSTTDEKLEILRDKKEAFQKLKKGLMQKLLTGEIRVIL